MGDQTSFSIHQQKSCTTVMVTLLGEYQFHAWFNFCASTWHLLKLKNPIYIINDGSLKPKSIESLTKKGFKIFNSQKPVLFLEDILSSFPYLKELRQRNNLFKKILDASILFKNFDRILFVDSDVIFRSPFQLPNDPPSFLFCIDEVPGYGGNWQIPIRYPIVTGLNSGFLYYDPQIVNLDFLEFIASKFFTKSRSTWWLEQSCWALLGGSIKSKGIFDGKDACVISSISKRSPNELKQNKTFYFRRSSKKLESKEINLLIDSAAVVHCAGPAKPWIEKICSYPIDDLEFKMPKTLNWIPIDNATWFEKIAISIRMMIKG